MKIQKIVFPVLGCLALMTSCKDGTTLTTVADRTQAVIDIVNATKTKLDNFGLNLELSNINIDTTVTSTTTTKTDPTTTINSVTRVKLDNLNGKLGVKVANLISDGEEDETVQEKTKYVKGYGELSDFSTSGLVAISNSDESLSIDVDPSIGSLKGYFTKSPRVTTPTDYVYLNLEDEKLNNTLDNTVDYLNSYAETLPTKPANRIKELISVIYTIENDLNIKKGKYYSNKSVDPKTITSRSKEFNNFIKTELEESYLKPLVETKITNLDYVIEGLGLPKNVFSVVQNGKSYTFSITLDKDNLNKVIDFFNEYMQPIPGTQKYFIIPNVTNGSVSISLSSNSEGALSDLTLNVSDLAFEEAFDKISVHTKTFKVNRVMIDKLSGTIKTSLDYSVTEDTVNELIKITDKNIWYPFN